MEVGTIFAKITKQKSGFQVTTPTSVASVKGTSLWAKQLFKAGTYYYGEEGGPTEVSNKAGSALFKEEETCYVESENHKPIVRKTKPGEKPNFGDEDSIDIIVAQDTFYTTDSFVPHLECRIPSPIWTPFWPFESGRAMF